MNPAIKKMLQAMAEAKAKAAEKTKVTREAVRESRNMDSLPEAMEDAADSALGPSVQQEVIPTAGKAIDPPDGAHPDAEAIDLPPVDDGSVPPEVPPEAVPEGQIPPEPPPQGAQEVPPEAVPEGQIPPEAPVDDPNAFPATTAEEAQEIAEAAIRGGPSELDVTNINFDNWHDSDDFEHMVQVVASQVARPDGKTVNELGEAGRKLLQDGYTVQDLLSWDRSQGILPEKLAANRIIMITLSKQLHKQADEFMQLGPRATEEQAAMLRINAMKTRAALEIIENQTRLASQSLNQFRYVVRDSGPIKDMQIEDIMAETGGMDAAKSLARAIADGATKPTKTDLPEDAVIASAVLEVVENNWFTKAVGHLEAWRYNNMLSGIETHERNLLGNLAMMLMRIPEKGGTVMWGGARHHIQRLLGRERVGDTTFTSRARAMELAAEIDGMFHGLIEGMSYAWKALKDPAYQLGDQKMDIKPPSVGDWVPSRVRTSPLGQNPVAEWTGRILDFFLYNMAGRGLNAGDILFKVANARATSQALAIRGALNEGKTGDALIDRVKEIADGKMPEDVFLAAVKDSQMMTFTNNLGKVGKYLGQARVAFPPLKVAMTFYKTLVNITRVTAERSFGLNLFPAFPKVGEMITPETRAIVKAGGAEADQYFGRVSMYAGLGYLIMQKAADGDITGTGACLNKETRAAWMKNGWKPNARVTDEGYQPMKAGAPITTIMSFYASLGECQNLYDNPEFDAAIQDSVSAAAFILAQTIGSQSVAAGLLEWMEAFISPEEWKTKKVLTDAANMWVSLPRYITQFESVENPEYTYTDVGGIIETVVAKARAAIPYANDGMGVRRDFWGRKTSRKHMLGNVIPTHAADPLWAVTSELVVNGINFNVPRSKRRVDGRMYDLNEINREMGLETGVVMDDWTRIVGEARLFAVQEVMMEPDWYTAPAGFPGDGGTRGDMLQKALAKAMQLAVEEMANKYVGTPVGDLFRKEMEAGTIRVRPLDPYSRKRREKQRKANEEKRAELRQPSFDGANQ